MDHRVARFSQIVKDYHGTSAGVSVGIREKDGKLQLAIGGRNPYDTAGRRVKQLKHAVSQLGTSRHEKTSYEGEKLKQFVEAYEKERGSKGLVQRLARQGIFKGTVTYGKLQSIARALDEENINDLDEENKAPEPALKPEEKASSAELEKTMSHPLEKKNAENTPPPTVAPFPKSPKAQAKQNWLKRNIKKERAASREKASLNAQRGILYSDLAPEDQASLKALAHAKKDSLEPDKVAVEQAQFDFKGSARQKLEQHHFPDLMRFANLAAVDKNIKYKTPELAQQAIRDKLAGIDFLIKDLQAEHVDLEGKDKKRMDDWIGSVKGLLNAWGDTGYINLDARGLGFVDEFCKQAESSFDTYHALTLKANNIDLAHAELEAMEEEPMERLLKNEALSPNAQGFLLQELARFSSQNPELKGLKQYEQFIQHLSGLESKIEIPEPTVIHISDSVQFDPIVDPIGMSGNKYRPHTEALEAFLAQESIKELDEPNLSKPESQDSEALSPHPAPTVEASVQPGGDDLRGVQYSKVLATLVGDADNRTSLNLALKAYAQKRNLLTQLIQAKLFGLGSKMASVEEIYKSNDQIKNWVTQDMFPRITNQSLSLAEMDAIDRNVTLYVASKNDNLFLGLEFKGQDDDLKALFQQKISQANSDLEPSDLEACSQKLMDAWNEYRDQIGAKTLIKDEQIRGFLEQLDVRVKE